MAVITNCAVLERHGIDIHGIEHLDLEVPVLTGLQRQGDVLVVPVKTRQDSGELVPSQGVTVVKGETSGGNAHILHALDGECYWQPSSDAATGLAQGWLTVPAGASATMIHTQEHNVLACGPGVYEVRREREFRNEWVRVAD